MSESLGVMQFVILMYQSQMLSFKGLYIVDPRTGNATIILYLLLVLFLSVTLFLISDFVCRNNSKNNWSWSKNIRLFLN